MKRPPGRQALDRQRKLRREATEPEIRLWRHLRNRQLARLKFRKQVWLGPFIVDFFCAEVRLVVELDGETHVDPDAIAYDARRSALIEKNGYRIVRFWNRQVMENVEGVVQEIAAVAHRPSPSHSAAPSGPLPLPQGGEGK